MTEGERLPYTLAVHRGDGENPHAHLMFSELERVKAWEKERDREWVHGGGYERARDERTAQITKKYSHAAGPQISNTPRSPQPTRGHERDVGPSR